MCLTSVVWLRPVEATVSPCCPLHLTQLLTVLLVQRLRARIEIASFLKYVHLGLLILKHHIYFCCENIGTTFLLWLFYLNHIFVLSYPLLLVLHVPISAVPCSRLTLPLPLVGRYCPVFIAATCPGLRPCPDSA